MIPVMIQGWRKFGLSIVFAGIATFVPLQEVNGEVMKVLIIASLGSNALVGSMRSLGETISRNLGKHTDRANDLSGN